MRLQVADLTRSLPFYEEILGLRAIGGDVRGGGLRPFRHAGEEHGVRRPERASDDVGPSAIDHARGETRSRAPDAAANSVKLGADGHEGPLLELVERPGARPVPRRGRLGLFHVALLLPERADLGRFVRHLTSAQIRPGMSDHLVSEAVYMTDPDGLGIEVYADRPRAAWKTRTDGQIEMATDPIDVRSLLGAAGQSQWDGLPSGTTVGHVHLHVGDLDEASAFYHDALGFDKTVWSYPGALFLSAGGYHHHLGANVWAGDVPPAGEDEARLLEWTLEVPGAEDVSGAARSLEDGRYSVSREAEDLIAMDPWGTPLRVTTRS